jgi:hypothetical protein
MCVKILDSVTNAKILITTRNTPLHLDVGHMEEKQYLEHLNNADSAMLFEKITGDIG